MLGRKLSVVGAIALGLSLAWAAPPAQAVTYAETGDAGDLPGTAQVAGTDLTGITGTLNDDVDMFRLQFSAGGLYTFATDHGSGGTGTHIDPELYLFDSLGGVIESDDDSGPWTSALNARISVNLVPGIYYLAIAGFYTQALDAGANAIADGYTDTLGAVVAGWDVGTGYGQQAYSITITGAAAAPEPATAGLGLLALAGVAATATRRRPA